MNNIRPVIKDAILAILIGILLGVTLSLLSPGNFWLGCLGIGTLGMLIAFGTIRVGCGLGADRAMVILMLATFIVRMVMGIFLYKGLPVMGFNNPVSKAGYVFSDAHDRDQAAYQIATSGGLLKQDLSKFRAADQYGGLLALSAVIYQVFSSDVQRPLIMVMVSAFAMTLGLAFLFSTVTKKWGRKLALAACWVFALYPDGILLGSSQMREPILIGLTCLLFWISLRWKERPIRVLVFALLVTAITCLFSAPAGGTAFVVVAGIVFFEWLEEQHNRNTRRIGITTFVVFLGLAAVAGWMWLKGGLNYEYYLTESGSGWITAMLQQYGTRIRIPFITFYGLTQPLLPAALIDPSIPLWKGIAIFRALGWYAILPFFLYGFFAVFKSNKTEHKSLLIFLSLAFSAWVLISSLRGGGDQWDNPRYRATFLPWLAILTGWVWQRIRSQKSPWFWRILCIEIVFVLFFLYWYFNKTIIAFAQIPFPIMIALILGISAIIVMGGFLWDLKRKPAKTAGDQK
jgi:hypothetical protein